MSEPLPSISRRPLSRELVLETAIALVDTQGAPALTMRRLAAELGVEAMSLYNHVTNKQDILDGMAALLIARMRPWTDTAADWRQALRQVCVTYRATITAHPQVFAGQGGRPLVTGEDRAALQHLLDLLCDAGFDDESATDLFQVGSKFTRGFALSDITPPPDGPPAPAWDADRAFERGLAVIINGFAAELHQ